MSYPGPAACEPPTYAPSVNGFTLTGTVIVSRYQGGKFWADYGNEANPYANIPFKYRGAKLTGSARIGNRNPTFAGD